MILVLVTVKRRRIDLRLFVFCILKTAQQRCGRIIFICFLISRPKSRFRAFWDIHPASPRDIYLFVSLAFSCCFFSRSPTFFIRRRHSAELAANSTVPAKNSFFFIYRLLSMPTVFCSIAHYDPVCKCVAGQFCRTVQYVTKFVENFTFSADFVTTFHCGFDGTAP